MTRWLSIKNRVSRYTQLQLFQLDPGPISMQLSPSEYYVVHGLAKKVEDLDVPANVWQDKWVHIYDICEYSDAALQAVSDLRVLWLDSTDIIKNIAFENSVPKHQSSQLRNETFTLLHVEVNSHEHLVKPQSNMQEHSTIFEEDQHEVLQRHALLFQTKNRRLIRRWSDADGYLDLTFVRPASQMYDRTLSVSAYALTKSRQTCFLTI